jgi:tetratricopeptide (TPR) repeat protein
MRRLFLLLSALISLSSLGAEPVTLVDPVLSGLTPEAAAAVQGAFTDTLAALQEGPTTVLRSAARPAAGAFVATLVSQNGQVLTVVLQSFASPQAAPAQKYFTLGLPADGLTLLLTRATQALLRAPAPVALPSPVLVDELSLASLQGTDLPVDASVLFPYGAALRPDGHLLVAAWATVLDLDAQFRVVGQPAKRLNDEGNNGYAGTLLVTPGGTLFVRSLSGGDVYSFAEGNPDYRRWRVPVQVSDTLGVLQDGSLFVVSPTAKKAVVYRGKDTLTLDLSDEAYVSAAAAGPENTLWVADMASGAVKVYFLDGKLKDVLFPALAAGTTIMKLRVQPDGSFVVVTTGDLRAYDRQGTLQWVYDGKDDGVSLNFAALTDLTADRSSPCFFAVDPASKKILRFWNPGQPLSPDLARVADLQKRLRLNPDRSSAEKELADAYTALGSPELAAAALDAYVSDFPEDAAARDNLQVLHVTLLKQKSAGSIAETEKKLKQWGPETARDAYSRAMKTLEALRALVPDDAEVRTRLDALRTLFSQAENRVTESRPLPQIASVELGGLFPSLMQVYLKKPAGRVIVKNTLAEPLKNVRVDFYLRKYMDVPAQGTEVASVDPGQTVSLDLPVVLNQSALDVEEDLLLQGQITLSFATAAGPQELAFARPVTLYRKTALTWDVTAKLASFITPNEATVDLLTHRILQDRPEEGPISAGFLRAVTLVSALGAIPLRYVPNPHTPVSEILGNSTVVDTVRFARTTLLYESGDCSDTTALTASLFESAGLPTAILTTPGHVFLAFDTGEREGSEWLFQAPGFETVVSGGKVWLPVETTVLSKGFTEAWRTASALVRTYRGTKDFEFIPVQGVRSLYPPLPLPPSTLAIATPRREQTQALEARALDGLDGLFRVIRAGLEGQTNLTGRALSRQNNKIAVLLSRYGKTDEAAALYRHIVVADPTFVPAYVNWANLNLQKGDYSGAAAVAAQARGLAPDSAAVAQLSRQIAVQGRPETQDTQGRASGETDLNWLLE